MFENLLLEMKMGNLTQSKVAKRIGISQEAFCQKLNGIRPFKRDEMFAVKEIFFPDEPLEYLFEKREEQ